MMNVLFLYFILITSTLFTGKQAHEECIADTIQGILKDVVVKLDEWDPVDSPRRIGEDIRQNASLKIEQGVEEVKETVKNVMETCPNDLLRWSKNAICDVRSVIGWCQLLGFSTAYGMGVWVTFFSGSVLGRCLIKQEGAIMLHKMNMVYFRAMGCCVGTAVLGFLASQEIRGGLSNKMEMFQGFNLVSALVMILINLIFLEPRTKKFIVERMKGTRKTRSVAAENLKKINGYSSTLNVLTMVVLTWHLAYIGQLLQARR
ncbi:hypothetical protein L1987_30630 [Smallanthus sonchifolius]|uniref:Uncharacterized protein n=1 Tax=Smallanthus sonchifolius TaxID=185202 RepID=A0ACB9I610_9ASTR|nr:hypothetical protein L1987_30630 [Smallanthus sonchifolius]